MRPRCGGPACRSCSRRPRRRGYFFAVKLRLYHHPDGARIAYREAGTGPPLALLHSKGLSHREFEPVVDELSHRLRVVLPDLPLHGGLRGPPAASVHAGVADGGARRLPARDVRAASIRGRPRGRRAARAAGGIARGAGPRAARAAAEPDARATGGRRSRADRPRCRPLRRGARLRPRAGARRPARAAPKPRRPTHGDRRRRRARPRPPRADATSAATACARGPRRRGAGRTVPRAACSTPIRG